MNRDIPPEILGAVERNFHDVIRGRAGDLIAEDNVEMPGLGLFLASGEERGWFPVPGMYGGFHYWFEGDGEEIVLITESWCRVSGGSGQRHEITASGSKLIDSGFV